MRHRHNHGLHVYVNVRHFPKCSVFIASSHNSFYYSHLQTRKLNCREVKNLVQGLSNLEAYALGYRYRSFIYKYICRHSLVPLGLSSARLHALPSVCRSTSLLWGLHQLGLLCPSASSWVWPMGDISRRLMGHESRRKSRYLFYPPSVSPYQAVCWQCCVPLPKATTPAGRLSPTTTALLRPLAP